MVHILLSILTNHKRCALNNNNKIIRYRIKEECTSKQYICSSVCTWQEALLGERSHWSIPHMHGISMVLLILLVLFILLILPILLVLLVLWDCIDWISQKVLIRKGCNNKKTEQSWSFTKPPSDPPTPPPGGPPGMLFSQEKIKFLHVCWQFKSHCWAQKTKSRDPDSELLQKVGPKKLRTVWRISSSNLRWRKQMA